MVDRVESRKNEKILLFLKVLISMLVSVFVGMIIYGKYKGYNGPKFSDIQPFILGLFLCFSFYLKFSKRKRLFIEWNEERINYKIEEVQGSIDIAEITNVEIDLDRVMITLKSSEVIVLNIQDFTDYDTRLKIKENFRSLFSPTNS